MKAVPAYIYTNSINEVSLAQGDVLKLSGSFLEKFNKFYPELIRNHSDQYVMVLTQSCDLVRTKKRNPKIPHINICLLRSIESVLTRMIDAEVKPPSIKSKKLLTRDEMDQLKARFYKLVNNNDQKMHFFLPKQDPFEQDMIAILHMSFPFRVAHYDELLSNRVLSLKPEFQAKLGHIISQLYGRIATEDLSDFNWGAKEVNNYINQLLEKAHLQQVPDQTFIDFILSKTELEQGNIEKLTQEHQSFLLKKQFKPRENEVKQSVKACLNRLFDNVETVTRLVSMEKIARSAEIEKMFFAE